MLEYLTDLIQTIKDFWFIFLSIGVFIVIKINLNTNSRRTIYQGDSFNAAKKAIKESIENNNEIFMSQDVKSDEAGIYSETKSKNTSGNSIWYGLWRASSDKEKEE